MSAVCEFAGDDPKVIEHRNDEASFVDAANVGKQLIPVKALSAQ